MRYRLIGLMLKQRRVRIDCRTRVAEGVEQTRKLHTVIQVLHIHAGQLTQDSEALVDAMLLQVEVGQSLERELPVRVGLGEMSQDALRIKQVTLFHHSLCLKHGISEVGR